MPLSPEKLKEINDIWITIRDTIADKINLLDADPPATEDEYLALKTQLMSAYREVSIIRVRVADAAGLD